MYAAKAPTLLVAVWPLVGVKLKAKSQERKRYEVELSTEQTTGIRQRPARISHSLSFHANRTPRGHCHYRDFGGATVAVALASQSPSAVHRLQEPPPPSGLGLSNVRRGQSAKLPFLSMG